MNNKKEGEYYSQMVRRFRNEYGGKNLQDFCMKEKVSYTKMLHCLRNDSYRKAQPSSSSNMMADSGLKPLVIESHQQPELPIAEKEDSKTFYSVKKRSSVHRADFCLTSGIRISLHGCDVRTLVCMIKEMEGSLC